MTFDPSQLSVAELRRRLLTDGAAVTPELLRKLDRDRRLGARQLGATLRRAWQAEQARRDRMEALLSFERSLRRVGVRHLAGVDEAGVGPLAGPVVAAAVVLAPGVAIDGVDDSKRLTPEVREELAAALQRQALGVGVGLAEVDEIDRLNVYQASLLAMRRAVLALPVEPDHVLVDAREIPGLVVPQSRFERGDSTHYSIAAASIIAKTHRDRLMMELDARYPVYGFARHKGYATEEHQEAIRRHGPSPVHRTSYGFLRELCGAYSAAFYRLQAQLERATSRRELVRVEEELEAGAGELAAGELKKLRLTLRRRRRAL